MTHDWPDELELTLDGIAQGGEGVGRWENRVVFAVGGLPGERVRVRLTERQAAFAHAAVLEILEASPDRVAPRDVAADNAPWQHISYPAQLAFKRQILADQLAKIAQLTIDLPATIPAAREWGYRSGARLHAAEGRIGYHNPGTRELREVTADPLLRSELNTALAALRQSLRRDDPLEEVTLRLSESYGYVLAQLRGPGNLRPLSERWRLRCGMLAGVVLPTAPADGAEYLIEELEDVTLQLRPASFFQSHLAGATTMLGLVRAGLAEQAGGRLLDLYSGVGTFTLPLARRAKTVTAVEEFAGAVDDADASAELSGATNVNLLAGRVETTLRQLEPEFEAIVLDPPRRGCHPDALRELLRLQPARIVYASCHPATLARDLKILTAGGYAVQSVQPVDMFPQTPHVESVTVLVRE